MCLRYHVQFVTALIYYHKVHPLVKHFLGNFEIFLRYFVFYSKATNMICNFAYPNIIYSMNKK